jgi:glyoxylase-like metal-dependent hydrolase (beta-lactamase superfamily II)
LLSLKTLAEDCLKSEVQNPKSVSESLLENSQKADGEIRHIELNPRVNCFPLKTETLPPATHTNCFIVGRKRFVVIDAASEDKSEQAALHRLIDSFVENNSECLAIITTHQHRDHTGGETILQTHLRERFNLEIPLAAHRQTADALAGKVDFQTFIEDGEAFDLADEDGKPFLLKTLHTPGHAAGLLAFYDAEFGFLLSGDNVVSSSSVVIAPPEGNLKDYLSSLERLRDLPNLRFLCGSHGAAVFDAKSKIESYTTHRFEREKQILEAIESGAKTTCEIVERVYADVSPALYKLAEKSVEAHLNKLVEEGNLSRERLE